METTTINSNYVDYLFSKLQDSELTTDERINILTEIVMLQSADIDALSMRIYNLTNNNENY